MSNRLDLEEFLSAYLVEVDEQLVLANAKLLAIETGLKQGAANPRAVRDLFRALHTVKGLSAMVGVEPIVAISHRMEAVLRVADRGGGKLAANAVDTLLKGVRAIEHRVRHLESGKTVIPPPAALLEELDALEPESASTQLPAQRALSLDPSLLGKLVPFEVAQLTDAAASGRRAVRADFVPSPEKAAQGLSITSIRDRVSVLAEIVKVIPVAIPTTADSPGGLSFAILMVTSATDEQLAVAIGVEAAEIHDLCSTLESELDLATPAFEDLEDAYVAEPQQRNVLRVDVARLDDAMERLSTLVVTRSRLARAVAALTAAGVNTRELVQVVHENARQLRDLRAALLSVRMVPMTDVLDRVPLIVRGLRRESGKQVRLVVDAGNAELDKAVAERIFPAIVHLIRNAVDHAIEMPDERARAGKQLEGLVRIACSAHSNTRLELTIADDGRGVSRADVTRRAGHELFSSDAALLDAICTPGLTTREQATTTSGRGMGMDIVRRVVVEQLGGELLMKTEEGVGTTFTLRVPLTIAIVDAFTLDCGGERFVVPVSMVEEIIEVDPAQIQPGHASGTKSGRYLGILQRRGEAVPLLDLASVFRLPGKRTQVKQALVVRRGGEPLAFGLDRVVGQQEAVVRPLVDPLVQMVGIAGATDLGDGRPTLVIDLVSLGSVLASRELPPEGERAA